MRSAPSRAVACALLGLSAGACAAPMQIFSSESDAAARVTRLTWFMIVLATVIYTIVIGAMVLAIRRNRARAVHGADMPSVDMTTVDMNTVDMNTVDMTEPGERWIVIGGAILPALVLGAVFIVAELALGKYPDPRAAITIDVTGRQWWWDVDYVLPAGGGRVRTANELHLPVGTPVRLVLTSSDVIHSFWVPQLQGKMDVIPGDTNELRITARTAGRYRGQCAEFCGAQHANMGIVIVADDSATFAAWLRRQSDEATSSDDSLAREGARLFSGGTCATCHTVRGTAADARVGPDLTHVGSRLTIAAGTLPNTLGNLEGWIANAQSIKPDAKMPTSTQFNGRELRALAAYVASLK